LNSTVSQPGSPTSCKSEKHSLPPSVATGVGGGVGGRCGGVFGRYLSSHPRLKKALGHIGLVILLACYTAAGAAVFQWLEQPHELAQSKIMQEKVLDQKAQLLATWDPHHPQHSSDNDTVLQLMDLYESALHEAVSNRVPLQKGAVSAHWTYTQSVFFSATVLTTIGYGNIAPATTSGRIFCIFFALIGIPFTLTVIADLGVLMAAGVAALYRRIRKRSSWAKSQSAQSFGRKFGRSLSAILIFLLLIVYIAIGGGIFMIWEDWNFLESFYFCFITMTTIGFGDLVPGSVSIPHTYCTPCPWMRYSDPSLDSNPSLLLSLS